MRELTQNEVDFVSGGKKDDKPKKPNKKPNKKPCRGGRWCRILTALDFLSELVGSTPKEEKEEKAK